LCIRFYNQSNSNECVNNCDNYTYIVKNNENNICKNYKDNRKYFNNNQCVNKEIDYLNFYEIFNWTSKYLCYYCIILSKFSICIKKKKKI